MSSAKSLGLPLDWAAQVHEAFVRVHEQRLTVDTLALPWQWRDGWAAHAAMQTDQRLFGVDVRFALIDRPIAMFRA